MVSSWKREIVRFAASRLGNSALNKEELKTGLAFSVPRGHISLPFLAGTPEKRTLYPAQLQPQEKPVNIIIPPDTPEVQPSLYSALVSAPF